MMWLLLPIDIFLLLVLHTFRAVFSLWPCEQRYLGLVGVVIFNREANVLVGFSKLYFLFGV